MRKILNIFLLLLVSLISGCSNDVTTPPLIEEDEVIVYPDVDYDTKYKVYQYSNNDNVNIDEYVFEQSNIYNTFDLDISYFQSSISQNTIFMYEHVLMFPENKDYEIFVRGLGDVRVYVGDSFDSLNLEVSFTSNDSVSEYDYYNENTFFKIENIQNKPVCIRVEVSTSVRAEFYLGMLNTIGQITLLSSDYIAVLKEEL